MALQNIIRRHYSLFSYVSSEVLIIVSQGIMPRMPFCFSNPIIHLFAFCDSARLYFFNYVSISTVSSDVILFVLFSITISW